MRTIPLDLPTFGHLAGMTETEVEAWDDAAWKLHIDCKAIKEYRARMKVDK